MLFYLSLAKGDFCGSVELYKHFASCSTLSHSNCNFPHTTSKLVCMNVIQCKRKNLAVEKMAQVTGLKDINEGDLRNVALVRTGVDACLRGYLKINGKPAVLKLLSTDR